MGTISMIFINNFRDIFSIFKVLNRAENRPFVAVFRDFMPDAESQEFLEMAKGRLHRSMGRMKFMIMRGKLMIMRHLIFNVFQ